MKNFEIREGKKSFWDAYKPFLASKSIKNKEKVLLKESDLVVTSYITKSLNINLLANSIVYNVDPVLQAVQKYADHPSIISIKRLYPVKEKFDFSHVLLDEVFCNIVKNEER